MIDAALELLLFCMTCSLWVLALQVSKHAETWIEGISAAVSYGLGLGCLILFLEGLNL